MYSAQKECHLHLRQLMKRYEERKQELFRFLYVILGEQQAAEDALQETFLKYMLKAPLFQDSEHEKAWLIKVTLNGCRKIWRSAWYRHRGEIHGELGTRNEVGEGMEVLIQSYIYKHHLQSVHLQFHFLR